MDAPASWQKARRRRAFLGLLVAAGCGAWWTLSARFGSLRRFVVVEKPGLFRAAWPSSSALERFVERERLRTVITLTAINRDDPKYRAQAPVLRRAGVDWIIVPMRGSTATLDQLVETADLLADPSRRPLFFHCVGGHHRSNLAQAAYRIRHLGWTAEQAWEELVGLPWTRPDAAADRRDHDVIHEFASRYPATDRERSQGGLS